MAHSRSPLLRLLALCLVSLALAACGGAGSSAAATPSGTPPATSPAPNTPANGSADIRVLMMGNSHTVVHDLPLRLQAMLLATRPGRTVAVAVAPDSMFLEEHLNNTRTVQLLEGQTWSAVILQAQKYSTSGLNTYSTREAETLVRMARVSKALPVLFPEWPRRGVSETERIYQLHASIAQKEPACVAPIGQAWDLALQRYPGLELHAADGNHAAAAGAHLTALVLFASLTGTSPANVPILTPSDIPATVQAQLRDVAVDTVQAFSPRSHCPADPLL